MSIDALQVVPLLGILWISWHFLRPYVTRSPLDNIPGPPSASILKGNILQLFSPKDAWDFHKAIAQKYGPVIRFTEMFGKRALYVFDPKALHNIIVKDQYVYERASFQTGLNNLLLGPGILSVTGDRHRVQRKSLNPVFSILHMRHITPVFYQTMHRLRDAVMTEINGSAGEVDMLTWMGRAALELIGQGGLGYSFDPLTADVHDTYGHALKTVQPAISQSRMWIMLSPYARSLGPARFRRFLANLVPDRFFQRLKTLADTMDSRSRDIFLAKKDALLRGDQVNQGQNSSGKDIMSILLKMNLEAAEEDRLSEGEVLAQMSSLVLAAMDTTSNALARTLQLLAQNPDVQEKLRSEIVEARDGQDLPYDRLVELPFLDAICRETLRLYPPVLISARETCKDAILPLSKPIVGLDGTLLNDIYVPSGTLVITGNWMSNTNKELWGEDADEWKPERWLSPLPDALKDARIPGVYSNLMTFIGGSRACLGFKFSQLEMKVVLSILLESFRLYPSDKEIFWNFANVSFPSVGGNKPKASLPLRIERISKVA